MLRTTCRLRCVLHNRLSQSMFSDVVESLEPYLVKGGLWLRDISPKDIVQTNQHWLELEDVKNSDLLTSLPSNRQNPSKISATTGVHAVIFLLWLSTLSLLKSRRTPTPSLKLNVSSWSHKKTTNPPTVLDARQSEDELLDALVACRGTCGEGYGPR